MGNLNGEMKRKPNGKRDKVIGIRYCVIFRDIAIDSPFITHQATQGKVGKPISQFSNPISCSFIHSFPQKQPRKSSQLNATANSFNTYHDSFFNLESTIFLTVDV